MLLISNGSANILLCKMPGKKQWWIPEVVVFLVDAVGYYITILFSATIWKTCSQLWIVTACPQKEVNTLSNLLVYPLLIVTAVVISDRIINALVKPLSNPLPGLPPITLATLLFISVVIGILLYGNTPFYPLYLPGQGYLRVYDTLQNNGNGNQWSEFTDQDSSGCEFHENAYSSKAAVGYFTPCYATITNFSNFAVEVDMKITKGDCGGVTFRDDTYTNKFYLFIICQDRTYRLLKYIDNSGNNATVLISGNSSNIKAGLERSNILTVFANGSNMIFYVNNRQITYIKDSSYSEGQIALFASASSSFTEVAFNNIKIWAL